MTAPLREFSPRPRSGVTCYPDGAQFCVYAGHAQAVDLCLFGEHPASVAGSDTPEIRHAMTDVGGGLWACFVPGVGPGTRYGFRADGPWDPRSGMRYNHAKMLTDPYALAFDGEVTWRPEVFGHGVDADFAGDASIKDTRDSAPFTPRSVVVDTSFDWGDDAAPRVPMEDTVLYEAHVRGFTRLHPHVPEPLRGTYAGMAEPAVIDHLRRLGVTSLELLPVHAFVDEPHLVNLGLSNFWGYNTLGFFAPHAAYAAATDPQEVVREFKTMVKTMHAAGIEVILDVVYNHTCEQAGDEGATLSLRGLDNRIAYRLDEAGLDIDVTGCGNTVDIRHPATMQLVLDSLRYWVTEMHVDGFRFDLAVALGRGPGDDFNPNDALLMAMRTDPVLSRVKLIAEPWDVGMHGWRTGQFPPPFSEWNDRFRNTARDFWLTDVARDAEGSPGYGVADLATRLAGSRDVFASPFRRPQASVNYVTAHDGFPLIDLTRYATKHNEANGEHNKDGTNDNRSWNHGVEGPSGNPDIEIRRMRSARNLLGTLILSTGVPMITAGDEFARTQDGNNNAYCQDSPVSWVDWNHTAEQEALIETVAHLLRLRRDHEVLRSTQFFPGDSPCGVGISDLRWFDAAGEVVTAQQWTDLHQRTLQAYFDAGQVEGSLLVVLHGAAAEADLTLPRPCEVGAWRLLWDSSVTHPSDLVEETVESGSTRQVQAASMLVFTPAVT